MATAIRDSHARLPVITARQRCFSDDEWRGMLAEDASAFKAVAVVLSTVLALGFLAIAGTVLWVLSG